MHARVLPQEIAGYIGRLLRESVGRGPKSVNVSLEQSYIVIFLRGFLSPLEEILVDEGQDHVVVETRQTLMNRLLPDIKANLEAVTEQRIEEIYFDWDLHNASGLILAVTAQPDAFGAPHESPEVVGALLREIEETARAIQRESLNTSVIDIDPQTFILISTGVLLPIETELIRLGKASLLKYAKRNLIKRYIENSARFSDATDLFVDWDFNQDKCVIVLRVR